MSFIGSIAKIGKSIIKSDVTKVVVGGAAIVFPPVGVPAVAALAVANTALAVAEPVIEAAGKLKPKVQAKAQVKAAIVAKGRAQIRAGVPRAKVKANMRRAAHVAARKLDRTRSKRVATSSQVRQHREQLAARLRNTAKLAATGDKGAIRALAVFKLVSRARKGDPAARRAVQLIAHRHEVGQRVRSRYELTAHGRIRARA
jgi:acetylornithine deacetylase/succinyl-diaminopimelate desuccinylase-like protein